MSVSEKNIESVKVEEVMIDKKNLVIMSPDKTADIALNTIMEENKSRIYVCENASVGKSSTKRTEKMQHQMMMTHKCCKRKNGIYGQYEEKNLRSVLATAIPLPGGQNILPREVIVTKIP
jgi:hypothetical protein